MQAVPETQVADDFVTTPHGGQVLFRPQACCFCAYMGRIWPDVRLVAFNRNGVSVRTFWKTSP